MTHGPEARGAGAGRHPGRGRRAVHAASCRAGTRDVRAGRARGLAARRRGLGRRQLPVRPRPRRQLLPAADAGRAVRIPRREDRPGPLQGLRREQHARPAAGREGRVDEAGALLGHHYVIDGRSSRGDERGRELGFPTANLADRATSCCRPHGVYATHRDDRRRRPPVDHEHRRPADVRRRRSATRSRRTCFDIDRDLYGLPLRLGFVQRLRDERPFEDVDALRAQIEADCAERAAAVRPHFAVESLTCRQPARATACTDVCPGPGGRSRDRAATWRRRTAELRCGQNAEPSALTRPPSTSVASQRRRSTGRAIARAHGRHAARPTPTSSSRRDCGAPRTSEVRCPLGRASPTRRDGSASGPRRRRASIHLMPMRLYNTLTRTRRSRSRRCARQPVRMYTCGLTVYARGHIGNFRTFVASTCCAARSSTGAATTSATS